MNATNVPTHRPGRAAAFALSMLLLVGGLVACGSNSDQERLKQDELARAKAEGARQARIEERTRQTRKETAKLRRELERVRRQGSRRAGGGSGGGGSSTTPASSGSRSCGGGLSVNSSTSCPFAENVRSEYFSSGRASTIEVFSPVTGQTYTMRCNSGSTHVCTGGNNAAVYFP